MDELLKKLLKEQETEMVMLTAENRLPANQGILRDSTDGIHPRPREALAYFGTSKKKIREYLGFDLTAFERELTELQEDFEALDAANGDFNIAFGSFSGGYTDEQVDEMNRLAELEWFEKHAISDEMVALLEQCMLEEELAFKDNTMDANEYLLSRYEGSMEVIRTVVDVKHREVRYDPAALSEDFFIPATPQADERKILASRTPSHEFLLEKRAENDLRRRNEGKKILSSRG